MHEINYVLDDFNAKIDQVIEGHEKDYFAAYRGHVMKIQRELEQMKRKQNEQEFLQRKDNRVRKLEI